MKTKKPLRFYLHGDIHEDGKRYYNRRTDFFEPLPAPEATAIDVQYYVVTKKKFDLDFRSARPVFRPPNAKNLFKRHPLLKVHHSTFRKEVRLAREREQKARGK